jgi:hypothetical protein
LEPKNCFQWSFGWKEIFLFPRKVFFGDKIENPKIWPSFKIVTNCTICVFGKKQFLMVRFHRCSREDAQKTTKVHQLSDHINWIGRDQCNYSQHYSSNSWEFTCLQYLAVVTIHIRPKIWQSFKIVTNCTICVLVRNS